MSTQVIFFGTEAFSLRALEALVEGGFTPALVVTKPDQPGGRGMRLSEPVVKPYALAHGIRVIQPERLGDISDDIGAIDDRIGVLSSYGKIIPEATLGLFERGIINVHPSLLPLYRGPSPIETAILNGDRETGVSLMRLAPSMDAGPLYAQQTVAIAEDERAAALQERCALLGATMLIDHLTAIIDGSLVPRPQDDSRATYTQLLNKKMAQVDPRVTSAGEIDRHVRAYETYPRTKLALNGHDIIITRAHVGSGDLTIGCKDGTTLVIDELIAPSGKKMTGATFKNGYGA